MFSNCIERRLISKLRLDVHQVIIRRHCNNKGVSITAPFLGTLLRFALLLTILCQLIKSRLEIIKYQPERITDANFHDFFSCTFQLWLHFDYQIGWHQSTPVVLLVRATGISTYRQLNCSSLSPFLMLTLSFYWMHS